MVRRDGVRGPIVGAPRVYRLVINLVCHTMCIPADHLNGAASAEAGTP
jgi:hypothetical protein